MLESIHLLAACSSSLGTSLDSRLEDRQLFVPVMWLPSHGRRRKPMKSRWAFKPCGAELDFSLNVASLLNR